MGFRNGAWMKIWDVRTTNSPYIVQVRGTTSVRKKGEDGRPIDEWETDFSGFCSCIGESVVNKIRGISPPPSKEHGVAIHLKSVDVKQPSVCVNGEWKSYTNFNIYDFDFGEDSVVGNNSTQRQQRSQNANDYNEELDIAYEGISDDVDDEGLPF